MIKNFFKYIYDSGKQIVFEIPKYALYYPLQILYFHGPALGSYGFWNGKAKEDICAQLTLMPAKAWSQSTGMDMECEILLEKKFHSFYISILFSMYIFTVYNLLSYVWYRYFLWKPFIKDIQFIIDCDSKKKLIEKKI